MLLRSLLAAALITLSACASSAPADDARCPPGSDSHVTAHMFFGRNIGDTLGVSEADWAAFLASEVTPRFPDGLTVLDAQGQWRDSDTGAIVQEPAKMLVLIMDDEVADRASVAAISQAYKTRFQQQGVAVMIERACVSF